MKTKHLLAPLAICCAVAALAGCTTTDDQASRSSLNEKSPERAETLSSTGLSQPVILDEPLFRKLELGTNAAVTLDDWLDFDTNVQANENFSTLDENDLPINSTEFLTRAPKHSKLDSVFGGSDQTNNNDFFWDGKEFQPQGLRLFTIHF